MVYIHHNSIVQHLKVQHPDIHKIVEDERVVTDKYKKTCKPVQISLVSTIVKKTPYSVCIWFAF